MALTAFPMESNFEGVDAHGNPLYDRAVGSGFFREFWRKYFTDGVFNEPADNFKVTPVSGTTVSVKLGECHIRGVTAAPDDEREVEFTLDGGSAASQRVDRFVLRADFEGERSVYVAVRKDWKSADRLTRNSNIWELAIADVLIRANARDIYQADITDLRLNTDLCGVVTEPVKRANTQAFFDAIEAEHKRVKSEWDAQREAQQSNWLTQMDSQAERLDGLDASLRAWYADIRADITKLQNFDFDNIGFLAGCVRETVFSGDRITEKINVSASGKLVAARVTLFSGNVTDSETTVYDSDGETVLWRTKNRCVAGDTVVETVTDGIV